MCSCECPFSYASIKSSITVHLQDLNLSLTGRQWWKITKQLNPRRQDGLNTMSTQNTDSINSNCEIYCENDTYYVMGAIKRNILLEGQDLVDLIESIQGGFGEIGGEVYFHRGVYQLGRPIQLQSNVSLRGSGKNSILLVSASNEEGMAIVGTEIEGATISSVTIKPEETQSSHTGISMSSCSNCKISNAFIKGFLKFGIHIHTSSAFCDVTSCDLAGNMEANVKFERLHEGTVGDFIPCTISNCNIFGGGKGVECDFAIVVNITACSFVHSFPCAIHIHKFSCSNLVSGCRTFQIKGDAVVVEDSNEINISSNIFCWHEGHGIVFRNVLWGTVSVNNVIDTGSKNLKEGEPHPSQHFFMKPKPDFDRDKYRKSGILLEGTTQGLTVNGNALFSWPHILRMDPAIKEGEGCNHNIITGNNINAFKGDEAISISGENSKEMQNLIGPNLSLREEEAPGFLQVFNEQRMNDYIDNL